MTTPGIDAELREVDGGNAVLLAEKGGNFLVLHEAHLDQVMAERSPSSLLLVQGLLQLLSSDPFLLEEEFANTDGHER